MGHPSNGGSKYFTTFIDDYDRKLWVYFLQEKSDAFQISSNPLQKNRVVTI